MLYLPEQMSCSQSSRFRAAAAEIPCAPSTLSEWIKKQEVAEAEARTHRGRPRHADRGSSDRAASAVELAIGLRDLRGMTEDS